VIRRDAELPMVEFSVRVYRALLAAYPAKFQKEYGPHMLQVFRDCCLRALGQRGTNGMLKLWAVTLFDLVQSAVSEHAQKEIDMKKEMKPADIRMAGWALIGGALVFAFSTLSLIVDGNNFWFLSLGLMTFLCMPLCAAGLLGMRNRYGEKAGGFGKNVLLLGAVLGPILSLIGFLAEGVDPLWILIPDGMAVLSICLALFGVVALYKKPFRRWNFLPLVGGLCFPILLLDAQIVPMIAGNWLPGGGGSDYPKAAYITLLSLQCITFVLLGYVLKSDLPEQTAALA
jgi:hypothetical protein